MGSFNFMAKPLESCSRKLLRYEQLKIARLIVLNLRQKIQRALLNNHVDERNRRFIGLCHILSLTRPL